MKRPPAAYLAILAVLALLGALVLLVYFHVPPFDNFAVFLLGNVLGILILLVFGVIGGAFVGMILAHRILANRQFSPFERTVLESLADIRERVTRLEKEERELRR